LSFQLLLQVLNYLILFFKLDQCLRSWGCNCIP